MSTFLWKIGGEAGFGIMVTGLSMSKIAAKSGYNTFDYAEYPSLIRGGHNTYEVHISPEEVGSSKEHIDLLVCLNKATFDLHKHRLLPESMVIYDPDEFEIEENVIKIPVPFKKFRKEFTLFQLMTNTIAMGASLALLGGDLTMQNEIIEKEFAKKGEEVVNFNKKLAQTGFDYVKNGFAQHIKPVLQKRNDKAKLVFTANDTFALGTVISDCRFFSAYPMTPTSNVLSLLAGWQHETGMVVRHAEDEIAVINSALGASFGGVRVGVSTSGGGFALMVEAVSFAGVAELPVVIFLGQRPGPATGMPTWTEQGELLFAAHAGHGEFPKIVLAPGDAYEMLELTIRAYDLADIYQLPVIVLGDKLICESHFSHSKDEVLSLIANHKVNRGKIVSETTQTPYLRYKLSPDGISESLIPGQKGVFFQANSYSHTEDSHTTEDGAHRKDQVDKINTKWKTYFNTDFKGPKVFGNLDTSEIVFVSWGGNKGAIVDAQKMLKEQGKETAFLHFTHVYPLEKEKLLPYFKSGKRYIMIENNSHAQFAQLLRQQTGIWVAEHLLKYDGRPFYPEEIVHYIISSNI
jgi:2-oxoglutarate ferredoxin oxidoreductase subunit alpha